MVSDLKSLKSHPDKLLIDHIKGVIDNVKKLTNSRIAELVAIFHDLGKINPNFQNKLDTKEKVQGYSNHSYLSAYAFFFTFCCRENLEALKKYLCVDRLHKNDLIALSVIIAKHHGNLPDFSPINYYGGVNILSDNENYYLFEFLNNGRVLPFHYFLSIFLPVTDSQMLMMNPKIQKAFSEKLLFDSTQNDSPLNFFIDYQFAFASVLIADKADAGNLGNVIDRQVANVQKFSSCLGPKLESYFKGLKQDSKINALRTEIREKAVNNIKIGLHKDNRVFELTAPTGSGKTLMLLSLAAELIESKGPKRIIYGLPFLSITEQVEAEMLKIFAGNEDCIQRIDSKAENHNFEEIQKLLEGEPTEELIQKANVLEFQENIFAAPFIITTFVRFFETLLSNRNADLLKLPNFSNCIFLLDEIQSLPPRLYGFFVAYIQRFCVKFDSYAIISTATQPNFKLPTDNFEVTSFFDKYIEPYKLLPLDYFSNTLFNRYKISFDKESVDIVDLKNSILSQGDSCLVILNTIDDTKDLYKLLSEELGEEIVLLLNTHITPRDRKLKIYLAKRRLRQGKRVIVVSTQLIEAGVDIDFPIVYRDFTSIASIVQSAGRCNRNGTLSDLGRAHLFNLSKNGKLRSKLIYRGRDEEILRITKELFKERYYEEKDLLRVQILFFELIQRNLEWGKHVSPSNPALIFNFMKDIKECMYEKVGKFQLIDEHTYGEEIQYYVPLKPNDDNFEVLLRLESELQELLARKEDKSLIRLKKKSIQVQLKKMSNQIIQIRLKKVDQSAPDEGSESRYYGLREICPEHYSFSRGVIANNLCCIV